MRMVWCAAVAAVAGFLVAGSGAQAAADAAVFEVAGTFSHGTTEDDFAFLGDVVCFEPTEETSGPIHKARGPDDARSVWFCFADTDKAKAAFGIPATAPDKGCGWEGTARVRIGHYEAIQSETDENDTADLIEILEKSAVKVAPCTE